MSILASANLVLSQTISPDRLDGPWLGHRNLLRTASNVSFSAETVGGEAANAYVRGTTYDMWRPGSSGEHWLRATLSEAKVCNYLAIAAHDLHVQAGAIKMQHSTDSGQTWSDSSPEIIASNSRPIMIIYDDTLAADHRFVVNSTGAVSIGVVYFGRITEVPSVVEGGFSPPYENQETRVIGQISEGGEILGQLTVARGARLNAQLRGIDTDFISGDWREFVTDAESYPFFFTERTDIAVPFYGMAESRPTARWENTVNHSVDIRARGIVS